MADLYTWMRLAVTPESRADSARAYGVGGSTPMSDEPVHGGGGLNEDQAIERARRGDRDAFERLLRVHADRLLGFLVRWLRNRQLAEDVFQEAAILAFQHITHLR